MKFIRLIRRRTMSGFNEMANKSVFSLDIMSDA